MSEDWKDTRRDTPALERDDLIHFNNAGAALMPAPAVCALFAHLHEENRIGGYEAARGADPALAAAYEAIANLLRCGANEVAFTENATRAWGLLLHAFRFRRGDEILISRAEYGANHIALLQARARYGVNVVEVGSGRTGAID